MTASKHMTDRWYVRICSYEHHSIDEPAILLGGAFVVNSAVEEIAEATKN